MTCSDAYSKVARALVLLVALVAAPVLAQDAKLFSKEQLDQMTAQVALYPDSLLSQLLMATTYPDEFAEAYQWSKAHPDAKGDDAVKMVEDKGWDPSVASMVGFPEVLITLGEKTDWVKNIGDAFLAQPEDVMDSVQRLRAQAQKAGNLKSNEQVKVSTEAAPPPETTSTTVVQQAPPQQVIVIEPAQPSVVYVPAYNPTVVYGPWLYPAYPPYYYPTPPGYWFSRTVATGIAWGVGIGISNALWGGFNWGRGDVNINVNRYNNINVNNRLDVNSRNTSWNHDTSHRKEAYRGGDATRQRLDKQHQAGSREQYRGRDSGAAGSRDASRERASQAMQSRGVNSPSGSAREREQAMSRDASRAQSPGGGRDAAQQRAQSADRDAARQRAQAADHSAAQQRARSTGSDNALRGASSGQARAQQTRGAASSSAAQRSGGGAQHARPSGGGGGARAGGGGGGGHRGGGGGRR